MLADNILFLIILFSKTPVKAQKRKVEETGQVEETTKKTRSRRN